MPAFHMDNLVYYLLPLLLLTEIHVSNDSRQVQITGLLNWYVVLLLVAFLSSVANGGQPGNLLSGHFKGLEPGKMPVISVTNKGDRDIDDIMMGISLVDEEGLVLFSAGYTDMVTGSAGYNANGARYQCLPSSGLMRTLWLRGCNSS